MVDRDAVRQVAVARRWAGACRDLRRLREWRRSPSLVLPADYSFAIWAPIYAGVLSHAIYQVLPSRRQDPVLRRTGWATSAGGLSGTWVWVQDIPVLQFPLIAATAAAAGPGISAGGTGGRDGTSLGGRAVSGAGAVGIVRWVDHVGFGGATTEILITIGVKAPWPGSEAWSAAALTGVVGAVAVAGWGGALLAQFRRGHIFG